MACYNQSKKCALLLVCGLVLGSVYASDGSSSNEEDWNNPEHNNAGEHDGDVTYWGERARQKLDVRGASSDVDYILRDDDTDEKGCSDNDTDKEGCLGLLLVDADISASAPENDVNAYSLPDLDHFFWWYPDKGCRDVKLSERITDISVADRVVLTVNGQPLSKEDDRKVRILIRKIFDPKYREN